MRMHRSVASLTAVRLAAAGLALLSLPALAQTDPRVGLHAGWWDAGQAARGMELIGSGKKAEGFYNPANPGDFGFLNGDLAFKGNIIVQGGFHGFQVWDVADPHNPKLRSTFVCPGGQGDVSVVRQPALHVGRADARPRRLRHAGRAGHGERRAVPRRPHLRHHRHRSPEAGGRGADLPRIAHAHARRRSEGPKNVYVYVSGTAGVRSPDELAGCSDVPPEEDPNTSLFSIDVIQVPLAHPQDAQDRQPSAHLRRRDRRVAGLWTGRRSRPGTQTTRGHRPVPRHHRVLRRSASPRARARATASCSTSAIRCIRCGSTRSPTRTSRTGTRRRSTTTARR